MRKVLCLYEKDMPTIALMKTTLSKLFDCDTRAEIEFSALKDVARAALNKADVVMMIRPDNILSAQIAQKVSLAGKFLIFFCDDDLLNLPEDLPSIPWRGKALLKVLINSNLVLSTSAYLLQKYSGMTKEKRGVMLDTVIGPEELPERRDVSKGEPIKLVYAAGSTHEVLFNKHIRPVLPELDRRYGDKLSLTFVNVHPDLTSLDLRTRIEYQPGMSLSDYRDYMRENKFDIGLAPLNTDDFSKCKYYNKYLEYTMVGVVGVYTDCEPYSIVVHDSHNGFLADNTRDSWLFAICRAVDDISLRSRCLNAAINDLRENFSASVVRERLLMELPELVLDEHPEGIIGTLTLARLYYKLSRIADSAYLSLFYFRKMGLYGLIRQIRAHIAGTKIYS